MPNLVTRAEIVDVIRSDARSIAEFFASIAGAAFFDGDSERWSPAHHLVHLTQANAAIATGLGSDTLPEHAPGTSRSYAEVRDAASSSLGAAPKDRLREMGRKVTLPDDATQPVIVEQFTASSVALCAAVEAIADATLDRV